MLSGVNRTAKDGRVRSLCSFDDPESTPYRAPFVQCLGCGSRCTISSESVRLGSGELDAGQRSAGSARSVATSQRRARTCHYVTTAITANHVLSLSHQPSDGVGRHGVHAIRHDRAADLDGRSPRRSPRQSDMVHSTTTWPAPPPWTADTPTGASTRALVVVADISADHAPAPTTLFARTPVGILGSRHQAGVRVGKVCGHCDDIRPSATSGFPLNHRTRCLH